MNTYYRARARMALALLAVFALVVVAGACGGSDEDAAGPDTPTTTIAGDADGTDAPAAAGSDSASGGDSDDGGADAPAAAGSDSASGGDSNDGGTDATSSGGADSASGDRLIVAIGNEPETLDVGQIRAGTDFYPAVNMFEQLLAFDIDGNHVPGLAESWEVSEDGLEFTFTLREGVTFHNGDPMTAEDVKFSFERYVDPDLGNVFAYNLAGLTDVEVVDENTVTIHLAEFDGAFLAANGYAYIVPKAHIEAVGNEEFAQNPVGTGPFKFVSRSIGEGFELERFDDYWGTPAGYEHVEFRIIADDNSRVSALRSGQVDLIAQVPPQNIEQLESDGDLVVRTSVTGDNIFLHFNGQVEGPWNDPDVRRALTIAVDQEAIRDVVLGGLAVPLAGVSALNAGYEDTAVVQLDYDPDAARQLLEEAGYGDGFTIELWGPVNGRLPNSAQVLQAVAGYWNDIGVDVDINIIEYSQWVDVQRNPSTAAGSVFGLWGDAATFDPQARMVGSLTCAGPYSHVCDPVVDDGIERVRTTVDPLDRMAAYEDVFRYVQDNSLVLYIYTAKGAFAMASDVDWQPWHGTPYTRMVNARPA